LDNSEKQLLTNLLRDDAGIADRVNAQLSWRQVLYVFMDRRIYLYALINVGTSGVLKFLSAALPSLVKDMSSTEAEIYLMTAPPYASALVCCLLVSYSASRRNEHGFHLIFSLSVALLGFILMLTLINRGKVALYVSLCITFSGIFSALPLLLSWLTNNVGGHTKRSIAIGFVVGIGQTGGIISPFVRLLLLLLINNYFILFVGF
jgi:MFS family permease